MHREHRLTPLVLLFAASLACALPAGGGTPPSGAAPSATEPSAGPLDEASAPAADPSASSGEWLELPPPPPAGILDALRVKVDTGESTYEEALVQSLRLFTGETQPEENLRRSSGRP